MNFLPHSAQVLMLLFAFDLGPESIIMCLLDYRETSSIVIQSAQHELAALQICTEIKLFGVTARRRRDRICTGRIGEDSKVLQFERLCMHEG